MIEMDIAQTGPRDHQLTGVMWNDNGLKEMSEYIKALATTLNPDIIALSETKKSRIVDLNLDLAVDPQTYRVIQFNCTAQHRGLVMLIRNSLRVETVELIRPADGDNFIQGIVVEDRLGYSLIFLYSAPTVTAYFFGETIKRLLTEYNVQIMLGDLNARHPAWCRRHDEKKKELQLISELKNFPSHKIHAAQQPTFHVPRNRKRGLFGSSDIDLIIAQRPIKNTTRLEGRIAENSDHFPVWFQVDWHIKRQHQQDAYLKRYFNPDR